MRLLTADLIYTPESMLSGYCLHISDSGEIGELRPLVAGDKPERFPGILCPGLVNAHCHSELSMMEGHTIEGAGMARFVQQIISKRGDFSEEEQVDAAVRAFEYMWNTGTVLLGDISNGPVSLKAKRNSPLASHTFVEIFSLGEDLADSTFAGGLEMLKQFEGLSVTLTHHAPYTMSRKLIRMIFERAAQQNELLSIHLLESEAERAIFETNDGPFLDIFQMLGIPFDGFEADTVQAQILEDMVADQAALFIHNTEMSPEELDEIATGFPHTYFCLCPRSNYFIHRTWPDANNFARYSDRICLGTDSIASNYDLNLFEEVKVLNERHPDLPLHTLLRWATTNGAKALQQAGKFGSFAVGTTPGINLISEVDMGNNKLTTSSSLQKLM